MKRIVYSENYKKHINIMYVKNAEVLTAKEFLSLHIVTTLPYRDYVADLSTIQNSQFTINLNG
jgi:hypothetical protein